MTVYGASRLYWALYRPIAPSGHKLRQTCRQALKAGFIGIIVVVMLLAKPAGASQDYSRFYGHYAGHIDLESGQTRKLEVVIKGISKGFNISWKTIKIDPSEYSKTKSYSIDFIASEREDIYGAAMKTNLFGGQEALDPMKGQPYFWCRIRDDTITVYGMLITEDGSYEIQRYDRTLINNRLHLQYTLFKEGQTQKQINAVLERD